MTESEKFYNLRSLTRLRAKKKVKGDYMYHAKPQTFYQAVCCAILGVFSISSISAGAQTTSEKSPKPPGRSAQLFYFEIYPKEDLNLRFESDKRCDADNIQIRAFETAETYPSTEKPTLKEQVRIFNIYVESFSPCSSPAQSKQFRDYEIKPDPRRMTHVYITAGEGVDLQQRSRKEKGKQ
jgi:hypothetical protein